MSSPQIGMPQWLHTLFPVCALRIHMDRTQSFRQSDQLFVACAKPHIEKPVPKERLFHWLVRAISLAYSSRGLKPLAGLCADSTKGLATLVL